MPSTSTSSSPMPSPFVLRPARAAFAALAGLAAVAGAGCSSSVAPAGSGCQIEKEALSSDDARGALAAATPGTCVIARTAELEGPFEVKAGVRFTAAAGERMTLKASSGLAVVTLTGPGAVLAQADVLAAPENGVVVRSGGVTLDDVKVRDARRAALAVQCAPACVADADRVLVKASTFETSELGAWVSGAYVRFEASASRGHTSTGLAAAAGLVVVDGARVEGSKLVVEDNLGVGVLVDGAATRVALEDAKVNGNGERGVWAQGVEGTADAPAVSLLRTEVVSNRLVGVGAFQARGIIIQGGRVADTRVAPVVTDLARTEDVGDGLGVFASSQDVSLVDVELVGNARAAGLLAGDARGIIIQGGRVEAGAAQLKIVVQDSPQVSLEPSLVSVPAAKLGVGAGRLAVGPVLP